MAEEKAVRQHSRAAEARARREEDVRRNGIHIQAISHETGHSQVFLVNTKTRTIKIIKAYAERHNLDPSELEFYLSPMERIYGNERVRNLGLEDYEKIVVRKNRRLSPYLAISRNANGDQVHVPRERFIRVVDRAHGQDTIFRVKLTSKIRRVMTAYAAYNGLDLSSLSFHLRPLERLVGMEEVGSLDLEGNGHIFVIRAP